MHRGIVLAWLLLAIGCAGFGRTDAPPAPAMVEVLRVTHFVGGTHHRTIVTGDLWYQTFGSSLLVLEAGAGRMRTLIELEPIGETGSATDMIMHGDQLFIVLDRDAVVQLDCADPMHPNIVRTRRKDMLRIAPRRLSVVNDELYVSGEGGVLRWSTGARYLQRDGDVSRVIASDQGPVACIDRRVYRLHNGDYVGSASDFYPLPEDLNLPEHIVFVRRAEGGAVIGLMTHAIREVDHAAATVVALGPVRSLRVFAGRLWIVTDRAIDSYRIAPTALEDHLRIKVVGARDVALITENYLAVAGSFGRAVYRINADDGGERDTFLFSHREPSNLTAAQSDGRFIIADGPEGAWSYEIGSHAGFLAQPPGELPDPPVETKFRRGEASISADGRSVVIKRASGEELFTEHGKPKVYCLATVRGELWIGHDNGITVHRRATAEAPRRIDRLRIEGPVRYLYPILGGAGAAYVSEFGGFGLAEYVEEPAPEPQG